MGNREFAGGPFGAGSDLLLSEMRRLDDPYRLWNQPDDGLTPPATSASSSPKRRAAKQGK